jgi:hypothetical protein
MLLVRDNITVLLLVCGLQGYKDKSNIFIYLHENLWRSSLRFCLVIQYQLFRDLTERESCRKRYFMFIRSKSYRVIGWSIVPLCNIEVLTAATMKKAVFWDVAPCWYCVNRLFGGTFLNIVTHRPIAKQHALLIMQERFSCSLRTDCCYATRSLCVRVDVTQQQK